MTASVLISGLFFVFSGSSTEETNSEESVEQKLLCRFVVDGAGRTVGESISLEDDVIIIKAKKAYLGVPLKHIEDQGKTLLVKGLIDYDKAMEMGEQWREKSFRQLHPEEER
jgi:hypothetical protein